MTKSYTFHNVTITLDEGDTYEVMYYHKGFMFVNMDGERMGFVPIHPDNLLLVIQDPLNKFEDSIRKGVVELLDAMIEGHELDFATADGVVYRFEIDGN